VHRLLGEALVDALVLDVRDGLAPVAFQLVESYPRIPVFAFSAFGPDDGRLLFACADAGLHGILVDGMDDAVSGDVIGSQSAGAVRKAMMRRVPGLLRLTEPVQRMAWEEVFARVGTRTTTSDVAEALGVTREHLSREFAAGGAPNLKRVIDLVRLVCAADLLANPGYSASTVASVLCYSSASHMGVSARRLAEVPVGGLAALGPLGVVERFLLGRTRCRL
jgi:AraC-like DNA-binding protein